MKQGKRYIEVAKLVDRTKLYDVEEAMQLAIDTAKAKFDETVELHAKLGVDGRQADQQVRGTCILPNGTGKSVKILVIAKGDKVAEAEKAGADFVGSDEMVNKILGGFTDFDVCITTPDMMGVVGRVARVLGPKGLMPNPKSGTVTNDVAKAIADAKAGKVEYRLDKNNIVHVTIGKVSFGKEKLAENFETVINALIKAKPVSSKGRYLRSLTVASTMGPGIKVGYTIKK